MSEPAEPLPATSATSVARYGGIMVAAMLLSRVLGMLRDSVISAKFGIGLDTDSYRLAVQIPDLIFMLIAGGGLSSAFIPVFSNLLHKKREKDAWAMFNVVVTVCAVIATVLIVIAWIFAPNIVHYLAEGKKDQSIVPGAIMMSRIMLPAQFAFLIGSILLGTLYSRKHFLTSGLAPNIYNVGIIAGALILPSIFLGMGVESMAWGALAGAIVGNMLVPTFAMIKVGSHFSPSFNVRAPGVRDFFVLLLPVIVGFSLPSMVNLVTQKFASLYGAAGVNSVLALSNNLMQAPLGIFGQSLAIAAFPILAEYVAINRMDLYRDQVSRTLRTVFYLGLPSGALMLALAPQIVHVLDGWNKAENSPQNLQLTVDCLRLYSIAIFAWCAQPVLMRGFFSLHKTFKPISIGTAMTGVFIVLCAVAHHYSPDFRLLPVVTDFAAMVLAVVLYFALESDVGKLDRPKIMATLVLAAPAAAIAGAASFGLMQLFHPGRKIVEICELGLVTMIGCWIYYFLTKLMRMPETEYVDRIVARVGRTAKR